MANTDDNTPLRKIGTRLLESLIIASVVAVAAWFSTQNALKYYVEANAGAIAANAAAISVNREHIIDLRERTAAVTATVEAAERRVHD